MSGPGTLLVTLAALYVVECIVIVRGGHVAFRGTVRGGWRVVRGGLSVGDAGTRIVLLPTLPWMRGAVVAPWVSDRVLVDAEDVRRCMKAVDAATVPLRIDALAMAVMIFVAGPLAVHLIGWTVVWPLLLASVLMIVLLLVGDVRAASRDLAAESTGRARWSSLVTLSLSPASAMRAEDPLIRDVLSGYSAPMIAHALCSRDEFEQLAAEWMRMQRRRGAARGADQSAAAPQDLRCETLERFIAMTAPELVRSGGEPRRRDPDARSYCPGCACEFAIPEGVCEACGGIALEQFGDVEQDHPPSSPSVQGIPVVETRLRA